MTVETRGEMAGSLVPMRRGEGLIVPAGPRRSDGPIGPTLLDCRQLAEWLNDTIRHVRRLVDEDRIPYIKVGHFVRFDPQDIAEWLDANRRRAS